MAGRVPPQVAAKPARASHSAPVDDDRRHTLFEQPQEDLDQSLPSDASAKDLRNGDDGDEEDTDEGECDPDNFSDSSSEDDDDDDDDDGADDDDDGPPPKPTMPSEWRHDASPPQRRPGQRKQQFLQASGTDGSQPAPSQQGSTNQLLHDAQGFEYGDFVKALMDCGGDPSTRTPAFLTGDVMRVIQLHDNGWLEVESGFISPNWVVKCTDPGEIRTFLDREKLIRGHTTLGLSPASAKPKERKNLEVTLKRQTEKLGLRIVGGLEYAKKQKRPGVFIKEVLPGGMASTDGRLKKNDRILRINSLDCTKCTHKEAVQALVQPGPIKITVDRKTQGSSKPVGRKTSTASVLEGPELHISQQAVDSLDKNARIVDTDDDSEGEEPDQTPTRSPKVEKSRRSEAAASALKKDNRKSGWLMKQGGGKRNDDGSSAPSAVFSRKNWKRRYFVLQETMLKYFKAPPDEGETALGYLNIDPESTVEVLSDKSFAVCTRRRMFHMAADTPGEARLWVELLKSVAQQSHHVNDPTLAES